MIRSACGFARALRAPDFDGRPQWRAQWQTRGLQWAYVRDSLHYARTFETSEAALAAASHQLKRAA